MKKQQKIVLTILVIFIIAYALNFVWEYLHYPLYTCKWPLSSCAVVTAFRDALIILGIYGGGSILFKNVFWMFHWTKAKITLLMLASFLIAYAIEVQGLYLGKWGYNALMPIIPLLNVGLSPIAQMILLPFAVFFVTKNIIIRMDVGGTLR